MLSHAATDIGYGWAFGVHEALDQFGAMFGPLFVALVLAMTQHDYKIAFASLAVPAVIMLSLLAVARFIYPRPHELTAGTAWVAGSLVIGALFNVSLVAIVVFSIVAELAGIPLILIVRKRMPT
jgi:hypothetical protein